MTEHRSRNFLVLFAGMALLSALYAQSNPSPATASGNPSTATETVSRSNDSASGGVIHEYAPPAAEYARAKAYSNTKYRHFFINVLYGLVVLLLVLKWRIAPSYRNWAERLSSRRFVQLLVFAPLTLLTISILEIPSDAWDQSMERAYGLSVQNWMSWLRDWITNQIVFLIVATLLVWVLYAVIRRSPRRWWLYFWMASVVVLLALFLVQPWVIDPLFYTFKPLANEQPTLVAELQKVVHRGGMEIPPERMFVMNASSKVTGLNAYVAGLGGSKRVVVWDNTIAKATVPETLFVFGHEMGHYVLLHIPKETAVDSTILLLLLYVGYRLSQGMLARWGKSWGIRDLQDWASLPALMFLLSLLGFFATPALNTVSRYFEHEADRYGLEVIHDIVPDANQVAAHYFEKSGEMNLADPNPSTFIKVWFFDHPTRPERVHFVATYDPWSKGGTAKYVK